MQSLRISLPSIPQGRLQIIDELKGFAIILVVLYHAGGVLAWNNKLHGELGVDIFVILSGAGLALSSTVGSARQFFGRRFLRIFPVYWLVLTAFLIGDAYLLNEHAGLADKVLHYLGIHALWGDQYAMTINDSFWFISLIVLCYVVYWLIRGWVHKTDWLIAAGSLISLLVTQVYLSFNQPTVFVHLATRLPEFFLGLLLGQLLRQGTLDIPLNWISGLGVFLLLYVSYLRSVTFYSLLLAPATMAVYACVWRQLLPAFFIEKVSTFFAFIGRHSLEIFLIHQPLIRRYNIHFQYQWFKITPPTVATDIIGMVVAFIFTVVVSVALGRLQRFLFLSKNTPA